MEQTSDMSKLKKNTYKFAGLALAFFLFTAIFGALIGKAIDNYFEIKPLGSILTMGVSYTFTWLGVYFYFIKKK